MVREKMYTIKSYVKEVEKIVFESGGDSLLVNEFEALLRSEFEDYLDKHGNPSYVTDLEIDFVSSLELPSDIATSLLGKQTSDLQSRFPFLQARNKENFVLVLGLMGLFFLVWFPPFSSSFFEIFNSFKVVSLLLLIFIPIVSLNVVSFDWLTIHLEKSSKLERYAIFMFVLLILVFPSFLLFALSSTGTVIPFLNLEYFQNAPSGYLLEIFVILLTLAFITVLQKLNHFFQSYEFKNQISKSSQNQQRLLIGVIISIVLLFIFLIEQRISSFISPVSFVVDTIYAVIFIIVLFFFIKESSGIYSFSVSSDSQHWINYRNLTLFGLIIFILFNSFTIPLLLSIDIYRHPTLFIYPVLLTISTIISYLVLIYLFPRSFDYERATKNLNSFSSFFNLKYLNFFALVVLFIFVISLFLLQFTNYYYVIVILGFFSGFLLIIYLFKSRYFYNPVIDVLPVGFYILLMFWFFNSMKL